ncbi:MAG: EAL domain-containing protein [Nitrospirota bacterium]
MSGRDNIPYRVLIVEDSPADAELNEREIRQVLSSCSFLRVDTEEAFLKALDEFNPDIIVSDYLMPSFDGMTALRITRKKIPLTPFIIVTGSMNEDTAVECMKEGATNYVIKQSLKRLGPAVLHALGEKKVRMEKLRIQEELRKSELRYSTIVNSSPNIIFLHREGRILFVNDVSSQWLGYSREELIGKSLFDFVAGDSKEVVLRNMQRRIAGEDVESYEVKILSKFNETKYFLVNASVMPYEEGKAFLVILSDITDRKKAEEALVDEANRRRILMEQSRDGIVILDQDGGVYEANLRFAAMLGYSLEEVRSLHVWDWDYQWSSDQLIEMIRSVDEAGDHFETRHRRRDGSIYDVEISTNGAFVGGQKLVFCVCRDISERKAAEKALRESEAELREAQRVAKLGNWELDLKTGIVIWSEEIYTIFGRDATLPAPNFDEHAKILTPASMFHLDSAVKRTQETGDPFQVDLEIIRPDGTRGWISARGEIKQKDFSFTLLRGTALDITDRKKIENELRASERELHDAYFSEAAINMILGESLIDQPLEVFLQKSLSMILSIPWIPLLPTGSIFLVEDDMDTLVMKAQSNIPGQQKDLCSRIPFGKCLCGKAAQSRQIQFASHSDGGHETCCDATFPHGHYAVPILFGGKTLGVLTLYLIEGHTRRKNEEDFLRALADTLAGIIARKKAEDKIEYLAYYDALTGLPNRNLFLDRLSQGIARAEYSRKTVAVMAVDIDRFKSINDAYGLDAGDSVLQEVAKRLLSSVREGDTIARLGNDDFGVLLIDIADSADIILVIDKIMKNVSCPLQFIGSEIMLTLSAGISVYPDDGNDASSLMKNSDLALAKAKQQGRKNYQFYTQDMDVKAAEFVRMEKNLFNAMQNNEFLLHYQPYWDINTREITGMEALIRWNNPEQGLLSPGKFIPVLEETRMIIEVGQWIIRTAVRQVKEWQNKGYPVVPVSVNLSLIQFRQKDLSETIKEIIRESGFYPSLLTLEITESAFIHDIELTHTVLADLKKIGVQISIDDFGTGYSSLAHLKRFPVDNLKIDMSFVKEIATDPDTASIVTAIIAMAHTLNLRTIAEGIETEEQWKILRLLRCHMGQGYYFSKPLPAEELERSFFRGIRSENSSG